MSEMSSLERVRTALERRAPDRVPLFEMVIDERVYQGILPGATYDEFIEAIGLDVAGLNRSSWGRENLDWVDEQKGLFRDQWGVIKALGPESTPYPVEGPIKRPEDLREYQPPDPSDPAALGHLDQVVQRWKGEKAIIFMGRDAFFNASFLRGQEQFLMDMILNPGLVHKLIELALAYDIEVVRRAVRAGAEVIIFGDDYADKNGPMMSPQHFREFILPGLKRAIAAAHEEGAYVVKHTDGNIWPLLDMIAEAGPDAINPLEPAAGMDIGEVKAKYGHRLAVVGNIDCGALLCWGTPQEVRATVERCILAAAPGGGHLLCSSNSIHSSVQPENYAAMAQACREFGRYPIRTLV